MDFLAPRSEGPKDQSRKRPRRAAGRAPGVTPRRSSERRGCFFLGGKGSKEEAKRVWKIGKNGFKHKLLWKLLWKCLEGLVEVLSSSSFFWVLYT